MPETKDKAEQVLALLRVGPLRDWATTDEQLDEIAAILRREYGDVRREALEEAARIAETIFDGAEVKDVKGAHIAAATVVTIATAIRAAKEETG